MQKVEGRCTRQRGKKVERGGREFEAKQTAEAEATLSFVLI